MSGWAEKQSIGQGARAASVSRRHLLGGMAAGGVLTIARPIGIGAQDAASPVATPTTAAPPEIAYDVPVTYPRPGDVAASPGTEISFRGVLPEALESLNVTGERSGAHPGIVVPHSDGKGASFRPDHPFHRGEEVTVRASFEILDADDGDFTFQTCRPRIIEAYQQPFEAAPDDEGLTVRSIPDFTPTRIVTTDHGEGIAPGYLFLAPKRGAGTDGAVILENSGQPVWYFPVANQPEEIYDFRTQQYQGQPVLTWWQGISIRKHAFGHFVIMNDAYELITEFTSGNRYDGADLHEFVITPNNTALINIYNSIAWDLTEYGGSEDSFIVDSIFQELDIATGCVLFEWHSMDHVPIEDTYYEFPTDDEQAPEHDPFHINSTNLDLDGHYIVDARNTWAVYKIDRVTGEVIWILGGKASDFELGDGVQTAWQHDAQIQPNGDLTLFDNGAAPEEHEESRGLVIRLDMDEMTAEVVQEYTHPDGILAGSQGNTQTLPNGNVVIGWGSEPVASEFAPDGTLLFDARMPGEKHSYRAYRFEWTGRPSYPPAIAAERDDDGGITVWASWNGATEVAGWQAFAGSSADALEPVGEAIERSGFETEFPVTTDATFVSVAALDDDGNELARADAVEV